MATAPVVEREISSALEVHKQDALTFAKQFTIAPIVDHDGYERACDALHQVVSKRRWWQAMVGPARDAAHKAHAAICAMEKTVDAPLANLELQFKAGIKEYQRREEQKRLAEENAIRERIRKEGEAQAKKDAEEAQLNAAIEAEEAGDVKAADAILDAPSPDIPFYVPPVIVPSFVPKQAGISTRETWKFRVVDFEALVDGVVNGTVPIAVLQPNEKVLGQQARALKQHLKYPGVEVWNEGSVAVKA